MTTFDPFENMNAEYDFGSTEEVAAPAASNLPICQWFHETTAWAYDDGKPGKRGGKIVTSGLHIEHGRWPTVDAVCAASNLPGVWIHHTSSGNTVLHWQLGGAGLYILAKRLYSLDEMGRDPSKRAGVAYAWPQGDGRRMSFQAIIDELLPGFAELNLEPFPIVVSLRKKVCISLHDALLAQYRVIKANDMWLASAHKRALASGKVPAGTPQPRTPFYGFKLRLEPGEQVLQTPGKNKGGSQGFEITTVRPNVPDLDPFKDVDEVKDYLREHATHRDLREIIERKLDEAIAWSLEQSAEWLRPEGSDDADPGSSAPATGAGDDFDPFFDSEEQPAPIAHNERRYKVPGSGALAARRAPQGDRPEDYDTPAPAPAPAAPAGKLEDVPGTAKPLQRRALLNLGNKEAAWRPGLSREEAGKLIVKAQEKAPAQR